MLDVANSRSSHVVPTPRAGGLACAAGVLVALAASRVVSHDVAWLVLIGAGVLASVGFIDDVRGLSVVSRLGVQVVVGALLGIGVDGWSWVVVGMVITPVIVNVVNFMDGINGITSLMMVCWGVSALAAGRSDGLMPLMVLGRVTAGSALGFLPWNAPVARLFPGDVGSYLFGGLVAGGIVYGWAMGVAPALLVAPLTIYFVDTFTVLVRRLVRGDRLFDAHREHVYQRLTSGQGLPHLSVATGVAVLSALITVGWSSGPWWVAATVTVVLSLAYLVSPQVLRTLMPVASRTT